MTKIDLYKHKERYLSWKKEINGRIPEVSKYDSDLILKYLNDMEMGINISCVNKKGARSYIRLTPLKERTIFFAKKFKEIYNV